MVELEGECQFSGDSGRWEQIATCSAGSHPSVSWSYLLILRCICNVNNTMCLFVCFFKSVYCTAWDKETYILRIKGELDLKFPGCLQLQAAEEYEYNLNEYENHAVTPFWSLNHFSLRVVP